MTSPIITRPLAGLLPQALSAPVAGVSTQSSGLPIIQANAQRETLLAGPAPDPTAGLAVPNAVGATRVHNDVIESEYPEALFVANSVTGNVEVIDPTTRRNLGSINVVPDLEQVIGEMGVVERTVLRGIEYGQLNHRFEPSNGIRLVDDLSVSPDGTRLYVSRSNLGDVVAIDLTQPEFPIVWRTPVSGGFPFRQGRKADHADLSPDGQFYAVSSTLSQRVDVFNTETGEIDWHFETGSLPHQVDWIPLDAGAFGGEPGELRTYLVNAGIGHFDGPEGTIEEEDMARVTVADPVTREVVREYTFEHGIRPAVFTEDGRYMVFQQSHFNGLQILDLVSGDIVVSEALALEQDPDGGEFYRDLHPTPSHLPHASEVHGLAGYGRDLITAATAHAAVGHWRLHYDAEAGHPTLEFLGRQPSGFVPYWVATTLESDGDAVAAVSESANHDVGFYDFETGQHLGSVPLEGRFPQRSRPGPLHPELSSLLNTGTVENPLPRMEELQNGFYNTVGRWAYQLGK